jgi:hypothetical protein
MRKIKSNLLGGHVRKLSVTTTIFILIVAGSICSALASYSFAKYETDPGKPGRDKAASITPKSGCCTQDFDKPHLLAASYYNVKDNLTATLMLNNKGPEAVEVKPTLFSLTGERFDVAPVIVAGESFRNIDLRELGALPGTFFEQGSIQLFQLSQWLPSKAPFPNNYRGSFNFYMSHKGLRQEEYEHPKILGRPNYSRNSDRCLLLH